MAWRRFNSVVVECIVVATVGAQLGCSDGGLSGQTDSTPDLVVSPDLVAIFEPDLAPLPSNACGDTSPNCSCTSLMPPFSLQADPVRDPSEGDTNLVRDVNGYLTLPAAKTPPSVVWVANPADVGSHGSISRIDPRTVRETARYLTVTCYSNVGGSADACDGTRGCCARDDANRFNNRIAGRADGQRQGVYQAFNSPSRTAVQSDGSVWVVNRTFGSGQGSVTRIAGDVAQCTDRNKNGRIDTSSDSNGDGLIEVDCNGDSLPDDLASVKNSPCSNNLRQEFYGPDDECVLFTTNFDGPNANPRGVASIPQTAPADVWVTGSQDGSVFRIDGATGLLREQGALFQGCVPDGIVIDAAGIGWVPSTGSTALCYFDTKKVSVTGKVRAQQTQVFGSNSVSLDRDGNVWTSSQSVPSAFRYTPDRTKNNTNLGSGVWTEFSNLLGNFGTVGGVAVDARSQGAYFAWAINAQNGLVRIPASTVAIGKMDQKIDGSQYPTTGTAWNFPVAVGVDLDQNIWGQNGGDATLARILVDKNGKATAPVKSVPKGGNKCPGGDFCDLGTGQLGGYSGFTSFSPITAARGAGSFSYTFASKCPNGTRWRSLSWEGEVPTGASLGASVRSGDSPTPDKSWTAWQVAGNSSPAQLDATTGYLQVQVSLASPDGTTPPTLHSLRVCSECL